MKNSKCTAYSTCVGTQVLSACVSVHMMCACLCKLKWKAVNECCVYVRMYTHTIM